MSKDKDQKPSETERGKETIRRMAKAIQHTKDNKKAGEEGRN